MHKTLFAVLAASLFSGCVATATTSTRRPPPPPPDEPVRVVEPPHREHHRRPPPPPPPSRGPRVIEGIVTDAATGQPIDRASVDITSPAIQGQMTVQTGPDGRFRTDEIPRGEFSVRCRREGYEVFQRKAVMDDGTAHVNFELRRRR
jgi:hypothetical protein